MHRFGKATLSLLLLAAVPFFAPAALAQRCCRSCSGVCSTPGIPATAYCCTGVAAPGNPCGTTTCGEWLGPAGVSTATPLSSTAETADLPASLEALLASCQPAAR